MAVRFALKHSRSQFALRALVCLSLLACSTRVWADFPARVPATTVQDGIAMQIIALTGTAPGQTMNLYLYEPKGDHPAKSLPCVFIAPAGSNLVTGMTLSTGDQQEHLPYAKAGFVVVAYELDGAMRSHDTKALFECIPKFMAAHGGVDNAKTAIDYALARLPEVDPKRLYVAGHSSAATVALDVAAADPRIKACCAYAPCPNLRDRLKPALIKALEKKTPGFDAFIDAASPSTQIDQLKAKPVLLFTAADDTNIPTQLVQDFGAALQKAGSTQVQIATTDTGGHYQSMIKEGIPRGIAYLKHVDATQKK